VNRRGENKPKLSAQSYFLLDDAAGSAGFLLYIRAFLRFRFIPELLPQYLKSFIPWVITQPRRDNLLSQQRLCKTWIWPTRARASGSPLVHMIATASSSLLSVMSSSLYSSPTSFFCHVVHGEISRIFSSFTRVELEGMAILQVKILLQTVKGPIGA